MTCWAEVLEVVRCRAQRYMVNRWWLSDLAGGYGRQLCCSPSSAILAAARLPSTRQRFVRSVADATAVLVVEVELREAEKISTIWRQREPPPPPPPSFLDYSTFFRGVCPSLSCGGVRGECSAGSPASDPKSLHFFMRCMYVHTCRAAVVLSLVGSNSARFRSRRTCDSIVLLPCPRPRPLVMVVLFETRGEKEVVRVKNVCWTNNT